MGFASITIITNEPYRLRLRQRGFRKSHNLTAYLFDFSLLRSRPRTAAKLARLTLELGLDDFPQAFRSR